MTERNDMIIALADASISQKGVAPVGKAFDDAVAQLMLLDNGTITERYNQLKTIDHETGYEVVWINGGLIHEMNM